MFTKLLVAYNGSDGSERALSAGIELAKCLGQELYVVMVEVELPRHSSLLYEMDTRKDQSDTYFEQLSRKAISLAQIKGVTLHTEVITGHKVGALVDYVERHGFDLILVGFHGHSALTERGIGSTALGLITNAPCSVQVVK